MQADQHIAIIVNGGVYSGFRSEGTPVLTQLLMSISKEYHITVFSLTEASSKEAPFALINVSGSGFRKYLNLYREVKKVHGVRPVDLFHGFFGWPAGFLSVVFGRLLSRPSLITLMGGESARLPEINFGMLDKPHLKRFIFWSIRKASVSVALSQYQKDSLISHGLQLPENMKVIPFGIPFTNPAESVAKSGSYQLIAVANINLIKNHPMMVRALGLLRQRLDVSLKIVGGDFLNGQVQRFTAQEGLTDYVSFTGQVSNAEAKQMIAAADAMVIASYSESFSVAFVEAMAVRVPVCSTPVGLMQELANTHCLTCPIDDHEQMATQLYELLTNDALRTKLVQNGKAWSKAHDLNHTLSEYRALYQGLIRK